MGWIGDLIGGVAGLFGGKKKQETVSRVDYGRMVKDATAAGFNPLTALRNGGSAGFTTTTGPTLSNLPEALGSLGGVLGDALENKIDPLKKKQRELDTALVDYQLRQLKQGPGMLYPGSTFTGTKVTGQASPAVGPSAKKPPHVVGALGPNLPPGAGPNGEIQPAVVAWRRSDNSLMYTYNPNFPDGDAQAAGAVADGGGRIWDNLPYNPLTAPPAARPKTKATREGKYIRKGAVPQISPSGAGRWGRYDRD